MEFSHAIDCQGCWKFASIALRKNHISVTWDNNAIGWYVSGCILCSRNVSMAGTWGRGTTCCKEDKLFHPCLHLLVLVALPSSSTAHKYRNYGGKSQVQLCHCMQLLNWPHCKKKMLGWFTQFCKLHTNDPCWIWCCCYAITYKIYWISM